MNENIYVTKRANIEENIILKNGFIEDSNKSIISKIIENMELKYRPEMESNPNFKQLIPYCVLTYQDSIFMYSRNKGSNEKRLISKYSFGIGGHIAEDNVDSEITHDEIVINGLKREIDEEVSIDYSEGEIEYLGLINDDSNDVGKVHIGLLFKLNLLNSQIQINEPDKIIGSFIQIDKTNEYINKLESWSSIILPTIKSTIYANS